jgi:NADH-quinone oxidoreductase subunit M
MLKKIDNYLNVNLKWFKYLLVYTGISDSGLRLIFLFINFIFFGLFFHWHKLLLIGILPLVSLILLYFASNLRDFYMVAHTHSFIIFMYTLKLIYDFINLFYFPGLGYLYGPNSIFNIVNFENFIFTFLKLFESPIGLDYFVGVDGLSLLFLLLTNFLIFLCIYVSRYFVRTNYRMFIYAFLFLQFFLIQFFILLNLFFFYVVFEAILIPMFFIIGVWGSRSRRTFAAYSFFLYTLFGSVLMLLAILYLFTLSIDLNFGTIISLENYIPDAAKTILFFLFFIGFSIKIPMFPFHLWLPEAHVEAPTLGSVILAGILLKLGGYGMLRFLLPIFPQQALAFRNFVFLICLISVLYSSFIGLCQLDLKKIVAYSSITHMNFSVAGLFSNDILGIQGAIYSMFSHGFISAALFLLVGSLYERYKTRLIAYYGGLIATMPIFAFFLFFFSIANVGIPPLSGFVSEIVILMGLILNSNKILVFLIFLSSIVITINFFWVFNRICSGPYSTHIKISEDLTVHEIVSLAVLALYVIFIGLFPQVIFSYTNNMAQLLLTIINKI